MKKIYFILGLLLFVLSYFIIENAITRKDFPDVYYLNLDKEKVRLLDKASQDRDFYVFYVNPTCDACFEINKVLDTLDTRKAEFVLISSFNAEVDYYTYFKKFNVEDNSLLLIDIRNSFFNDFKVQNIETPTILLFNGEEISKNIKLMK